MGSSLFLFKTPGVLPSFWLSEIGHIQYRGRHNIHWVWKLCCLLSVNLWPLEQDCKRGASGATVVHNLLLALYCLTHAFINTCQLINDGQLDLNCWTENKTPFQHHYQHFELFCLQWKSPLAHSRYLSINKNKSFIEVIYNDFHRYGIFAVRIIS